MPLMFLRSNGKPDPTDAQSPRGTLFACATQQAGCEMCSWQLGLAKMAAPSVVQVIDPISMQHTRWNNEHQTAVDQLDSSKSQQPPRQRHRVLRHQGATNPSAAHSANASPSRPLMSISTAKTIEGVRGLKPPLTICHPLSATVGYLFRRLSQ